MEEIVNKLKKILYNIVRKYYLKKITRGYGKIIEKEDKIICNICQKKLDKNKKNNILGYVLLFLHDANFVLESKEMMNYFDLNKPIYYVFDNITFKNGLTFYSNKSHVFFKNCKFYRWINIPNANEVTFENNQYFSHFVIHSGRKNFFYGFCRKLTFLNDHFCNYDLDHHPTKFGMNIEADILEFNNTKINSEYPGNIEIEANKTIIKNSNINAYEISLNSKNIDYLNSSITALNGVVIENKDCNVIKNINSPVILYNDFDLSSNNTINKEKMELAQKRKQIIENLKNLKEYLEYQKQEKIKIVEQSFNNQAIEKVLKR